MKYAIRSLGITTLTLLLFGASATTKAIAASAATAITVHSLDNAPVVTAPATVSATSGILVTFTVSASDPDGDAITLLDAGIPTNATFTVNATNTSGTFSWTPNNTQLGLNSMVFTASNALSGSAQVDIDVALGALDPIDLTVLDATYTAPDGVVWKQLSSAPGGTYDPFLRFQGPLIEEGLNTDGGAAYHNVIGSWTHSFTFGELAVTNVGGTDYVTLALDINETTTGGDNYLSLDELRIYTVAGDSSLTTLSALVGAGAVLRYDLSDQRVYMDGNLAAGLGHPDIQVLIPASYFAGAVASDYVYVYAMAGAFGWLNDLNFGASDGHEQWSFLEAGGADTRPIVSAPGYIVGTENVPIHFEVTASDPDGDALTSLTTSPLPAGAVFTSNLSNTSGTFDWTPDFAQSGTYDVTFTAANALSGSTTTTISVSEVDRGPVVTAPATVSGDEGTLITFPVLVSDPDGDPITYFVSGSLPPGATFTVDAANTSGTFAWTPTYTQSGLYYFAFTAINTGIDTAYTEVTVNDVDNTSFEALAFVTGGDKTVRLRSGKPSYCVEIEPAEALFQAADIDPTSVVMRSVGTGSVSEISAISPKSDIPKDMDRNGVLEYAACFGKSDLALLFSQVTGRQEVPVTISGRLESGATFLANLTIDVIGSSGSLAASVAPNPFNPATKLSFEMPRAGAVQLQVFDLGGRLVRDLTHGRTFSSGYHEIAIDGRDGNGRRLASGVYFYRLATPDGMVTGRLVLME